MTENDIERLMAVPEAPIDSDGALTKLRARIEREQIQPIDRTVSARESGRGGGGPLVSFWVKGLAAAASIALALTLLTVSGVAETILTIFEPKQVVAVPITTGDLMSTAGFAKYGTLTWSVPPKPYDVPDLATAAKDSGLTVLTPAQLPPGVSVATARYGVMPRTTATFTFSADLTRQSAATLGRTPPPMPANIDGSKLFITGGPAVMQSFSDGTAPTAGSDTSPFSGLPTLVIAQGKGPTVQSDGVTVEQLQQYLLAQPGISPSLAAQIRAIKDPSSTLPIPIPVDMATSKNVNVNGVQGVFVGDSTGLGSAVIWSKDGIVYGVAGTLTELEILAVANSLR
ncbi:MAG: DUF4367 domain-containing protein [Chloroflexota bacterium]|nr:DUF4367 domain-containing protein [Chloroflexota bacterium]